MNYHRSHTPKRFTLYLVGMGGIEPPASVLSGLRSTTELHAQNFGLFGRTPP